MQGRRSASKTEVDGAVPQIIPRPGMTWHYMFGLMNFAAYSPAITSAQKIPFCAPPGWTSEIPAAAHSGGDAPA